MAIYFSKILRTSRALLEIYCHFYSFSWYLCGEQSVKFITKQIKHFKICYFTFYLKTFLIIFFLFLFFINIIYKYTIH
jgi:hypothetical protein